MPKISSGNWIKHGSDGDDLFVDDGVRVCAVCSTPKVLSQFHTNKFTGKVNMACRLCSENLRRVSIKEGEVGVADKLVGALSRATGRSKANAELGPLLGPTLKMMSDTWGGEKETAKRLAAITTKALDDPDTELGLKAVKMLLDSMARAQKMAPEPIDVRELSSEDLRDVLIEPARQLILEDAEFRRELLNMPDVRAALLGEEGVNVLDSDDYVYDDEGVLETA